MHINLKANDAQIRPIMHQKQELQTATNNMAFDFQENRQPSKSEKNFE